MMKGIAVAPERPVSVAMPFERHLIRTVRLAGPVIFARAGLPRHGRHRFPAMLGHYGTESLAYYAARMRHVVMILIGVGLLQGTVISSPRRTARATAPPAAPTGA